MPMEYYYKHVRVTELKTNNQKYSKYQIVEGKKVEFSYTAEGNFKYYWHWGK